MNDKPTDVNQSQIPVPPGDGLSHREGIMELEQQREEEQLRKVDKLRKHIQAILRTHVVLLVVIFLIVLAAFAGFVAALSSFSATRYQAKVTLCFHPKHKGKIGHYDDRYLLRILNRRATRDTFTGQSKGKEFRRRKTISENIRVTTDRKHPQTFFLELSARSEHEAVEGINHFANICIQEYIQERTKDLQQWKKLLNTEKEDVAQAIQKLSSQITDLTTPLQMATPEKDHERLRQHMNELQISSNRHSYVVENLTLRKKQLESELAEVSPMLLANQKEIREFFKELEALDKEIAKATELYTDENPKMIALNSRRSAVQKRLDAFLGEKKIKSADPQAIRHAETLNTELKSLNAELETKLNEKRVLDGEIADCAKRLELFKEYYPKLQLLYQERRTQRESMKRLEESIAEIDYAQLMVKEDLFVNEPARSAWGNKPFSAKNLAVSFIAAMVLTALFAALVTLVEFIFGAVFDVRELKLYDEFHFLGVLPTSVDLFQNEDRKTTAFKAVLHNFKELDPKVVFTGCLTGARLLPEFLAYLQANFYTVGKRTLLIDVELASDAQDVLESTEPGGDTVLVVFAGNRCILPLSSKKFLTDSEIELLKNDFMILKEQYDYIFIRHSFPLRRSKLLLEEIASQCDAALYTVGAGKTPRQNLRELREVQLKVGIPVMTVLSDHSATRLNRDLELEAEL